MGNWLLEIWLWLRRLPSLPGWIRDLVRYHYRYHRGDITYGCAGLVAITAVIVTADTVLGPWSVTLKGISLIDGQPRLESSDCDPDLVSPYLAQVLVGYELGLSFAAAGAYLHHLKQHTPELQHMWG